MPLGMLGKYERLDVLGHGASGIVYLARDTLLRRQVALKEITAQGDEQLKFLEEARVLDRLHHPNIVQVNGVDTINGKVVIDMEYVAGRNLQDVLRDADGPLSVPEAVRIATQICDGLAYAHANHTVHRDVKPANILVGSDGQVKLVDFGLAEVLGTNSYAGGAGTYAYMAPEDFDEIGHSDAQSDLWAAGVILYEMLTGRRPFHVARPKDPFAWGRAVSKDDILVPSACRPGVGPGLDAICLKALERDKTRRYQTGAEIADDLRALSLEGAQVGPIPSYARKVAPRDWEHSAEDALPEKSPSGPLLGASDIDQFLEVAVSHWPQACEVLSTGALAAWLRAGGEPLLGNVADELAGREDLSLDARLRDFLYRSGLNTEEMARMEATRGNGLLKARQFQEASSSFRRALRLDPMHPSYYHLLAHAYTSLQNPDEARSVLEEGLALFPGHRALRRDLKSLGGGRAQLSALSINFGDLRPGESRTQSITLRTPDQTAVQGRVASLPGWLKVTPLKFSGRPRQILKLEADTAHLPAQAGEYGESVVLETSSGRLELPVSLTLLPPRPGFWQVFHWYLPMAAVCLLPILMGYEASMQSHEHGRTLPLYPAGYIASGALFVSFLGINIQVDTQRRERFFAGLGMLLAPIGMFMFFLVTIHPGNRAGETFPTIVETGLTAITLPLAQGIAVWRSREAWGRWPIWAGATALVCAVVCALLWGAGIAPRVH